MYLEISPRQSGKTTRLIDHAIKTYDAGHGFIIFCANYSMQQKVQKEVENKTRFKPNFLCDVYSAGSFNISQLYGFNLTDAWMYFDVFDWFPREFWNEIQHHLYFNLSYFATTPSRLRDISILNLSKSETDFDDMLALLLVHNYWEYEYCNSIKSLSHLQGTMLHREYVREVLGQFIKI